LLKSRSTNILGAYHSRDSILNRITGPNNNPRREFDKINKAVRTFYT